MPALHRLTCALVTILLVAALSGCGTSDDPLADAPDPPPPTETAPAEQGDEGKDEDGGDGDGGNNDGDGGGGGGGGRGGGGGGGRGGGGGGGGGGNDDNEDEGGDGGNAGNEDEPRGSGSNIKTTRRIVVSGSGDELRFEPSGLLAPPGEVTIVLVNQTDDKHAIAIAGDDVRRESDPAEPGEETEVKLDLPAGQYEFYDPLEDYRLDGLTGILSVGRLPPQTGP